MSRRNALSVWMRELRFELRDRLRGKAAVAHVDRVHRGGGAGAVAAFERGIHLGDIGGKLLFDACPAI